MALEIKGVIVPNDDQEIYEIFGYSTTSPNNVRSALADAKGEPLDVEISTCYGGDIDAGSEIYSILKAYKGGIQIHITGLAASAASVIAMAGPSEMAPTARMLVHNVSTIAGGNYHDMDHSSEMLQQADKSLAAAYIAKSGMSEKDALAMMDKETYLTAQQAVDLKLVDKVMFAAEPPQLAAGFGLLPRAVIEKMRAILAKQKQGEKPDKGDPPEPDGQKDKEKTLLMIDLI